jgi:hypothetical protein
VTAQPHDRADDGAQSPPAHAGAVRPARSSGGVEAPALPEALAERRFERQRHQAILTIGVLAVPMTLFGINDVLYASGSWTRLSVMLGFRAAIIAGMAWVGMLLSRASTREQFERILFIAMLVGVGASLATHFSRPASVMVVARFELMTVVGYYVALPMRTRLGAIPAVIMSVMSVSLALWWHTGIDTPDLVSLVICFGLANALGILIGRQREADEAEEELAWRALTAVNANLRKTLAELRALRSVVPVCPSCRKVRGSNDGWQQLEAYVAERSDITFSAILCPDCLQREFGAVLMAPSERG